MLRFAVTWFISKGCAVRRSRTIASHIVFDDKDTHATFITQGDWVWKIAVWQNGCLVGAPGGFSINDRNGLRKALEEVLCLIQA